MFHFFIHRLITSFLTVLLILTATFVLLHTIPGGPFDSERKLPPEIEHNLQEKYGLHPQGDQSFVRWILMDLKSYGKFLMQGQGGPSLKFKDRDVVPIILEALPPTLILGVLALLIACISSLIISLWIAAHPQGAVAWAMSVITPLTLSLPRFSIAALLIFVFASFFKFLPPALWEGPRFMILPLACLVPAPMIYLTQLLQTRLLDERTKDYIRTASAKGLPIKMVLLKHALKNALSPFVTAIGSVAAQLMTGSFIVETIFSIPGLGKHFVNAVVDRDFFLVMGVTFFYGALLVTLNFLSDIMQMMLDPRVRS